MKSPYTPPLLVGQMCDCYLDEIRQQHSSANIKSLNEKDGMVLGQRLIRLCNIKTKDQKI